MLTHSNTAPQEAVATVYQLTQEEKIRQQCEAREDYYRRQNDVQRWIKKQDNTIQQQAEAINQRDKKIEQQTETICQQAETIYQRDKEIAQQAEMINELRRQIEQLQS